MHTQAVRVHPSEVFPPHPEIEGILPPTSFPVVVGDFSDVSQHVGDFEPADPTYPLGLRKPALQHHRSAQVLDATGQPIEITDGARHLLVTAKGINMSRPVPGVVDGPLNHHAYTYGLLNITELGAQFDHTELLTKAGMPTEWLLGALVLDEIMVDGEPVKPALFAEGAMIDYLHKLSKLRKSTSEKIANSSMLRRFLRQPHVVMLRATEAVLRLADVQDAPQLHQADVLARVPASGESGLDDISLPDYFAWFQERLARGVRAMHDQDLVHRVLYHGGNITTNAEIVDLDSLATPARFRTRTAFEEAKYIDIHDAAHNIYRTQAALGVPKDASIFLQKADV